jgi:hypothetical protein
MSTAGWSGYAEKTELSETRWRLRQPDGRGNLVEIEIEFPLDYGPEQREAVALGMLSGLQNALNR